MNLAIASPSAAAYSETFIQMQFERLPWKLRIHGGPVASETVPGGAIAPLRNFRGKLETLYFRGLKHEDAGTPQEAELKRRLRKHRIDTLLANFGPTGCALRPVCRELKIRLVVHFHGYDAHRAATLEQNRDHYLRLAEDAAAIVVVSDFMARSLEKLGFPSAKLHLTRYGVDETQFTARRQHPETPVFLGVGRFVDKKAPHLTLLAFSKMRKQCPSARLILAGDGPLLESTRNLAYALGVGEAVEFPGVLSARSVAEYMRNATAFVQHSVTPMVGDSAGDSEGTPVAILEAMMAGLPVISTRHAGIAEVITDGKTGILVGEHDVQSMADAMTQMAQEHSIADSIGARAREHALQNYAADRYIAWLQDLLKFACKSSSNADLSKP